MSFLAASSPTATMGAADPKDAAQSLAMGLGVAVLAAGAWVLELRRRAAVQPGPAAGELLAPREPSVLDGGLRLLRLLLPEVVGLTLCLALALLLLANGANNGAPVPVEDAALWGRIRYEWPALMTADSLLGLQAMLRTLLLVSAALRAEEALASPLAGWPVALLLLASAAGVALLALSPRDIYHLDGPLGGRLHASMELACLLLLARLALSQLRAARRGPRAASCAAAAAVLAVAGWLAAGNRLALADPGSEHLDMLFSLRHLLELAASFAYLARSLAAPEGPSAFAAFAGALLPLQQLLAAAFLITAWGGAPFEEVQGLVGAGRPLFTLQLAALAQAGAYAAGGLAQLVLGADGPEKKGAAYIEL